MLIVQMVKLRHVFRNGGSTIYNTRSHHEWQNRGPTQYAFDENKSKFMSTEMKNNDIGIVQIKTNLFVSLPIPYVNENKFDVIQ
jgi:hypothetical protein